MWKTLGCLVVVLLASTSAFDRSKAKEKITDFRVRSQNLHVDSIEKELDKLDQEFEELSQEPDLAAQKRVKARVYNLEGNKCPEKTVSCRGDWPECVGHLLVCDGIKDCHNGMDEDERVCDSSVVKIGSSFRGIVHWQRCFLGFDQYATITITQTKRSPFFNNRSFLKATVTRETDDGQAVTYGARGYFVYAARKLVLLSEADSKQHLGVICDFNQGDNDHASCKVVQESSLEQCGLIKITRV